MEGRRNANPIDPWATIDDGGNNPPQASQDATRFGNVTLGESRDERFRINNTDRNTPLVIESVRSQISQYTFPDLPGGGSNTFVVPSGGEREFVIRFTPTNFSPAHCVSSYYSIMHTSYLRQKPVVTTLV